MSERKVLNKYYPPNFDPSKVPRRSDGAEAGREAQHTVRLMAPFSMRCEGCGEYIYKGRKFNARKEAADGERYLGIRVFRFRIRCPQCSGEITYKTDPRGGDYVCEHGARRNFEPWRVEEAAAEGARTRRALEEADDPLRRLTNRTVDSKRDLDIVASLDEIRTKNARLERVDADALFERVAAEGGFCGRTPAAAAPGGEDVQAAREAAEDDALVAQAFASPDGGEWQAATEGGAVAVAVTLQPAPAGRLQRAAAALGIVRRPRTHAS